MRALPHPQSPFGSGVRLLLVAFGLAVVAIAVSRVASLLLAVLLTIILALALEAFASRLERRRVPRAIGALIGLAAGAAILVGVVALVVPPFVSEVRALTAQAPGAINSVGQRTGAASGNTKIGSEVGGFLQGYVDNPQRLAGSLAAVGPSVISIAATAILVAISAYYMAARPEPLVKGLMRCFPPPWRPQAEVIGRELRAAWLGWLRGVAIDMVTLGILVFVGLTAVGLPFAVVFAVFAAVMVVVPYFGTIIAAVPPLLFALSVSSTKALLTLGVYVLVQQIESHVVIPQVMSRTLDLHPALVAIGVVLVHGLFGFVGLLVAVPLISAALILARSLWIEPMEAVFADRGSSASARGDPGMGGPTAPS